jgi:hypothetical protein
MTPVGGPGWRRNPAGRVWIPRQHGAWAMLLLPLLLGTAASRPSGWQLVLGVAALTAYLASAAAQAWFRGRRPPEYRTPILAYGAAFAVSGLVLVVAFPALLLSLAVVLPAGTIVLGGARPGTRRDLANSLAQVAQALVLVPASAYVSGVFVLETVVALTIVAAAYLLGSVLVVRSVLRERGNPVFASFSIAFHLAALGGAAAALPIAYAFVAAGLTVRALALPLVQRRLAAGPRPLRPVQVGIVEMAASLAVVIVAFVAPA